MKIFFYQKKIKKKINKNTLAIVTTNMFNTTSDIMKIQRVCKKKNIPLIEDNAIYFGNYISKGNKKIYSGSFGDFSLHSFNIMKNISAMYGGSVSSDDKKFIAYAKEEMSKFKKFSIFKYFKQCFVFIILKFLSINIFYKIFFFDLIRLAHKKNNKIILNLVYPSLQFKKKFILENYYKNISSFSVNMIFYQLNDKISLDLNHKIRKENNIYYSKKFKQKKIKSLKFIEIKEQNFQNFNDFPIIVKNKKLLLHHLFSKGIETKDIQYVDCHKIFTGKNIKQLDNFENKILCLPNHVKISQKYIDYIVNCIDMFYKNH